MVGGFCRIRIYIRELQRRVDTTRYPGLFVRYSHTYKIIDYENYIKVSQNPNKVARDAQGLPTVPHNDFGGLNFKCLASKYLLLMIDDPPTRG